MAAALPERATFLGDASESSDDEMKELPMKRRDQTCTSSPRCGRRLSTAFFVVALCSFVAIGFPLYIDSDKRSTVSLPATITAFPCDDIVASRQCDADDRLQVAELPPCSEHDPANVSYIAVVGNYGRYDANCGMHVAKLLRHAEQQFGAFKAVITTGGNNYPSGDAKTLPGNVDVPFGRFLADMDTPRFFPTMSAVDFDAHWDEGQSIPYLQYFRYLSSLPRPASPFLKGHAYRTRLADGLIEIFTINSNLGNPDAPFSVRTTGAHALQRRWLRTALRNSTATWRFVVFSHSPFSTSRRVPEAPWMRWPFHAWGAHAVFTGAQHAYERLHPVAEAPGMPYFVNGLGGHPWRDRVVNCRRAARGSAVRYSEAHGLQVIAVSHDVARTCFYSTEQGGTLVDAYTLLHPASEPGKAVRHERLSGGADSADDDEATEIEAELAALLEDDDDAGRPGKRDDTFWGRSAEVMHAAAKHLRPTSKPSTRHPQAVSTGKGANGLKSGSKSEH